MNEGPAMLDERPGSSRGGVGGAVFFWVVVEDRMRGGVGRGSVFLVDRRYK